MDKIITQNIESMDRIREQTNQRVAKYREKQKSVKSDDVDNANNTNRVDVNDSKNKNGNVSCNVTVTQCNATEEERRKKREESREKKEEVVEVEEVGIEKNEKEKFKTTTADISNELNNLPCERDLSFLENNVPKAFEFYEENFIKPIGKLTIPQAIANNLIQAIETMGDDLVLFALQKTLEMGELMLLISTVWTNFIAGDVSKIKTWHMVIGDIDFRLAKVAIMKLANTSTAALQAMQ